MVIGDYFIYVVGFLWVQRGNEWSLKLFYWCFCLYCDI